MTAYNQDLHGSLWDKIVAGTMVRYVELSTIPGNPAGSEKVKRLMAMERGLNLVTEKVPMNGDFFENMGESNTNEWFEQILNAEDSVIFFTIESGWMLFNTEGDLMGFIWLEVENDLIFGYRGEIVTMVADYHEDFVEAVTKKSAETV